MRTRKKISGSAAMVSLWMDPDVHNVGHWAKNAINYVVGRGIFSGTGETTFRPDRAMTRGMVATVLYNLEGAEEHDCASVFTDVPENVWYSEAVCWAAGRGVVSGYGDGTFRPTLDVTREQIAVMLWNYVGKPESSKDLSGYPDADQISGYAKQAMARANELGIINGMKNGTLAPQGEATRGQIAQMMMNYLNQ